LITFQREVLLNVVREMSPMLQQHFAETGEGVVEDKEYPLDVDWGTYGRLEESGALHVFTARDESKLVGYIWFIVNPSLHMKGCLTAYEDIHYLAPSHRKGWNMVNMFKYAEKRMKEIGASRIMTAVKIKGGRDVIFTYLGYTPTEKLFVKGL
jgi:ABC-type tungstate transport system permease subunit